MMLISLYFLVQFQNQIFAQSHVRDYYEKVAVTGLCEPGQYFHDCFESQKLCHSRMREFIQSCLDDNSSPVKVTPQLNFKVGICLGSHFEKKYQIEKKTLSKCFQLDKWN